MSGTAREVTIRGDGPRDIVVPVGVEWDEFFDAPGVDLGGRSESPAHDRERF